MTRIAEFIDKHFNLKAHAHSISGISTTDLVDKIFTFCQFYSGRNLFAYQAQFSKRIIRSVLENDGAELTALFARQSGKTETVSCTVGGLMIILPTLANMPMFAGDKRLETFKHGFWVGIFAPSLRQSQITYRRMKNHLQCKSAMSVLADPDFNLEFTTSNGQTVALSNGSYCTAISASDGSNIEGETFMFIICEECFVKGTPILTENGYKNIECIEAGEKVYSFNHNTNEVELKEVVRSFSQPIYNRKIVKIKTSSGREIVCTDNHKIYVKNKHRYIRADQLQIDDLMLLYTHTTQESEVELYDKELESNDSRYNARRREHTLSRQKVFKIPKIHSKSISKAGRLCMGEVCESERVLSNRAKESSKQRKGSVLVSLYNKMFTRNKGILRLILQKWEESNLKRHTRLNERRGTSLLVSRRWKLCWNDVYSHAMLLFRGKQNSSELADRKLWNNTNYTDRQKNKSTISVLQRKGEEQISEVDRAICDSIDAVQDSHNRYSDTMCNMWERGNTLSSEKGSILLRKMQKRISEKLLQRVYEEEGIREEKIVSLEIIDTNEVVVYDLTVEDNHNFFANGLLVHNCQDISNYKIRKSIHPMGAAFNATICKIGTPTTFKGDFYETIERNKKEYADKKIRIRNHFEYGWQTVQKYNPQYKKYIEREKRSLGENSDEFRMSYNLEWIISRGMFIDIEEFEQNCGDPFLTRVAGDTTHNHVAGIDVGGGSGKNAESDSTVITILEVDWDCPVLMESEIDEETQEETVYLAFNTYLKDWLELGAEVASDYNEQYALIMEYLKRWKISRLCIDATREASLGQRISANVKFEVILFVFGSKSKSELYKNFDQEINTGRFHYPIDEETKETREYQRFIQQTADLQKSYSGSNLVVSHPPERGAHDDYPDSLALALWASKDPGIKDETETSNFNNVFRDKPSVQQSNHLFSKNRYTARRR